MSAFHPKRTLNIVHLRPLQTLALLLAFRLIGACMHFNLPTPLNGWREFAGEVGIIVSVS